MFARRRSRRFRLRILDFPRRSARNACIKHFEFQVFIVRSEIYKAETVSM